MSDSSYPGHACSWTEYSSPIADHISSAWWGANGARTRTNESERVLPLGLADGTPHAEQVVRVLHERRDGGVEAERLEVVRDLLDEPVRPAGKLRGVGLSPRRVAPGDEREGPPEEAGDALDAAAVHGPPSFHGPMNIR